MIQYDSERRSKKQKLHEIMNVTRRYSCSRWLWVISSEHGFNSSPNNGLARTSIPRTRPGTFALAPCRQEFHKDTQSLAKLERRQNWNCNESQVTIHCTDCLKCRTSHNPSYTIIHLDYLLAFCLKTWQIHTRMKDFIQDRDIAHNIKPFKVTVGHTLVRMRVLNCNPACMSQRSQTCWFA